MNRDKKIRQPVFFVAMMLMGLFTNSSFAQPKGFTAANSEALPDPLTVRCKIGTQWYSVRLAATGFKFDSSTEAQGVTEEVLKSAGYLPGVVLARAALVGNAEICRSTDLDYILYNPEWFKEVYKDTEIKWADRAIFAHELGHYEHNDDRKALGSTPAIELAADEYAGEVLAKMGAKLDQAQAAFRSARMKAGSHGNHPSVEQRVVAVEKGWMKINPLPKAQSARQYLDSGNGFYYLTEYDKAIADYTKAIEIDPKYILAYYDRGMAFHGKREYDKAIADYTKAIELDPKYFFAYYYRGIDYGSKREYDKAIADYTKAIELDPKYVPAYFNRGVSYASTREYDKAIADYTKAIEIDPKYIVAYIVRGMALDSTREYDKAIADYTKAIEIDPKYILAYDTRGNSFYNNREYDKAIADYTKAIEIDPKYSPAYYNRGNSFYEKREYDKALADYTKIIEIDPKYALAYVGRARVYRALGKNDLAEEEEQKVKLLNK